MELISSSLKPPVDHQQYTLKSEERKNPGMWKAAQEFESIYLYQVLEAMKPERDESGVMNGGFAEEMFSQTLNEQVAKAVAERGGVGIAENIYDGLVKFQEAQQ